MRQGNGWLNYASVFKHNSGVKVHMLGLIKLPNGDLFNANKFPECVEVDRMIKINGGNRRRGLMAFAMMKYVNGGKVL